MLRIALISTYGVRCGIATYSSHLVEQLSKNHEVTVFAEDYQDNRQSGFHPDVKVLRCYNRKSPSDRLVRCLKRNHFDIVHIQHEYGIFSNMQRQLLNIAGNNPGTTFLTSHTVNSLDTQFDLRRCADRIIVHNELGKRHLTQECGLRDDTVQVIPHGTLLLPPISKEVARLRLGLPPHDRIVLTHSFIERRKNLDIVMSAVAEFQGETPTHYIHSGSLHPYANTEEHAYAESLKVLPEALGIGPLVHIIDRFIPDDELAYYLSATDIIVVLEKTSYPELRASGIMHTTVPGSVIVASNISEFDEFPDDTVYKVEINKEALVNAMREIFSKPALAHSLANNLLRYAKVSSWENVAEHHIAAYQDALSPRCKTVQRKTTDVPKGKKQVAVSKHMTISSN